MKTAGSLVRWAARVLSIVSLGLLAVFFVGEGIDPSRLQPGELVLFLFFPLGVCAGMLLGWWCESIGGLITVLCTAAFYLVHWATSGRLPRGPYLLLFALPGLLFLAAGMFRREKLAA